MIIVYIPYWVFTDILFGVSLNSTSEWLLMFSVVHFIELLFIATPPPLIGEQYGQKETKYPKDDLCQSILHPIVVFNMPSFF